MHIPFIVLILTATAFLLAVFSIPLVKRLAWSFELVDHPAQGPHKSHLRSIPYGGGVAIYLGVLLPFLIILLYMLRLLARAGLDFQLVFSSGIFTDVHATSMLLGCASILFLVGFVDDWRGLTPLPRFLIEVATASWLVIELAEFRFSSLPGQNEVIAGGISVVWIVCITNAYNFLDNMDGLAAGVAGLSLLVLGLMALSANYFPMAILCFVTVGAIAGFLCYNFPPASIFMGDAGGLFLGFLAGSTSILLSQQLWSTGDSVPRLLAPFTVLAVPLYDLLSVIIIRTRAGNPLWIGDNNHLSHRLVAMGATRRQAVLIIYLLTLLTGLPALFTLYTNASIQWILVSVVPVFMLVLARTEILSSRRVVEVQASETEHDDSNPET